MPKYKGSRTRDYPFSLERDNVTYLVKSLCELTFAHAPGQNHVKGSYSCYDLITSLALVDNAMHNSEKASASLNSEYYTFAIIELFRLVFPRENEWHRACLLLGIDKYKVVHFGKKANKTTRKLFGRAITMSVIANYCREKKLSLADSQIAVQTKFGIHPSKLEDLKNLKVNMLYVKTRHVQQFLDRCLNHFILRGASFWCSQVLSIVRDTVCEYDKLGARLYTDSDSVIIMLVNNRLNEVEIRELITNTLTDREGKIINENVIFSHYPRLNLHYERAIAESMDITSVIPAIGISLQSNKSLLDFALDRSDENHLIKSYWSESNTLYLSEKTNTELRAKGCTGVDDSKAYTDKSLQVPEWYRQKNKGENYGWQASLFSLTDISFKQQYLMEMQRWLSDELGYYPDYFDYSKNIGEKFSLGTSSSFIKIDGDNVGRYFTSAPSACRPRFSICLEENIKHRFKTTILQIMQKYSLRHLPIDLIYFGGDDLVFVIPSELSVDFIELFSSNNPQGTPFENSIKYTFSEIFIDTSKIDNNLIAEEVLRAEIPRFLNPLLNIAKKLLKDRTVSNVDDDSACDCQREKYLCNISESSQIKKVQYKDIHGLSMSHLPIVHYQMSL